MRKTLLAIIMVGLFSLTGCGANNSTEEMVGTTIEYDVTVEQAMEDMQEFLGEMGEILEMSNESYYGSEIYNEMFYEEYGRYPTYREEQFFSKCLTEILEQL